MLIFRELEISIETFDIWLKINYKINIDKTEICDYKKHNEIMVFHNFCFNNIGHE